MKSSILTILSLVMSLATYAQTVFINEIHYDNASSDTGEGVEVAGPAGTDLSSYSLVAYNGNGGSSYQTISLSGTLPNQDNGFGTAFFAITGLQNGSPDGVALVQSGTVIQFLSYEGTFTAVGGPADGMTSTDIAVTESGSTPVGFSLQLSGTGSTYSDFSWATEAAETYNAINAAQSFGGVPDTIGNPGDTVVVVTDGTIFINEIHYDNSGADTGEGVEVAGTAGLDLFAFRLVLYNGNGGSSYSTVTLTGSFSDQQAGFGTAFFPISGLQNGSPDGIALVDADDNVIEFLSYEGSFVALGGPADGMNSTDIGVVESSGTAAGFSLQKTGTGSEADDFIWVDPMAATYDAINTGQTFVSPIPVVFINELHYDNASSDTGEAIEVAGTAGTDLSEYSLVLYNGNGGSVYKTTALSGILPDQDNGYGTLSFAISGIQNGSPDGVALVTSVDSVLQFLSYEGSFVAVGGPADGMSSTDIGVSETGSTPVGYSLQLTGTGNSYTDFVWAEAMESTFDAINTDQSFGGVIEPPVPDSDTVTVAQARAMAVGEEVVLLATLTATDQFGGPAYLQDSTAGIALFDFSVHGEGLFDIGDQLWITAEIGTFSNQIQLVNVDTVVLVGQQSVSPDTVTIDQLANYEGQLITIQNATFAQSGGLLYPNSNYDISDATGSAQVRIDADVDLVGRMIPAGTTTITGVLGRYQSTLQLLPRFIPDMPDAEAYEPAGSDIPFENTVDIATWNMEFFGSEIANYGPSDVALQMQNAITILENLHADIIAVQEVSEESLLDSVATALGSYNYVCSQVYSYSFEEPNPGDPFPAQKLCYLYDTTTVDYISDRVIFDQFYTDARTGVINDLDDHPGSNGASSFWSSGRLPYMLTAQVSAMGATKEINLVNIHAKSGAGSNDLARRAYDVAVLKDTLDAMYGSESVIILGDYNDDLDESIGGGVSSYEVLLQDTAAYQAPTLSLSEAGFRSYLFADNMIDHIMISNELISDLIEGSETTIIPFGLVDNYSGTTSDHLPVRVRFDIVEPIEMELAGDTALYYGYEPLSSGKLSVTPSGGVEPYSYLWSTGETHAEINVAPSVTTTYSVQISDNSGQVLTDSLTVYVEDVTCGRRDDKVSICWRGNDLCVPSHVAERMLERGASLGSCGPDNLPYIEKVDTYPNPFYSDFNVRVSANRDFQMEVLITDFCGMVVHSQVYEISTGMNHLSLQLTGIPRGFYFLQLINRDTGSIERRQTLIKK
ncbi:DUF5689 domain-containing protein [Reichenbachiella ulvae]|uniref:DUF5689 domain-containing protein n=1 Tax=Reichenbachiella ulvae TaxID=2980104 RepID=A0ABT3CQ24_9BACT|nr:DUF5689 domain-containing protein [Reichenbachiella ulvae]MCV9385560.1 DUF5689 domain-containing protein [Reichenbachiella ulvae]